MVLRPDETPLSTAEFRLSVVVPRIHVKIVKTALEQRALLDKTSKILPETSLSNDNEHASKEHPVRMVLPTTIRVSKPTEERLVEDLDYDLVKADLLRRLGFGMGEDIVGKTVSIVETPVSQSTVSPLPNAVLKALSDAVKALPEELLFSLHLDPSALIDAFPTTYSTYSPMLLLPSHAFSSTPWTKLITALEADSPQLQAIWKRLASSVGKSHVAINAAIPLKSHGSPNMPSLEKENILRSPTHLTPLYGADWGPYPTLSSMALPTGKDLGETLWVWAKQNGIYQTWAPRYTMFSRGNVKEKARLLQILARPGRDVERDSTAVDLYAGIGYFSFSYKQSGIRKVLCWELNPWSIEGLHRGAAFNGWSTQAITSFSASQMASVKDVDFLVFQQDNKFAPEAVTALREGGIVPPIRHVNCGLLPSSRDSWGVAVQLIDTQLGGWIHAHENVGIGEMERRREEVVDWVQQELDGREEKAATSTASRRLQVECEHVERVKTYAPGVMHVVFDLRVEGRGEASGA
ncbi:hypothetical protein EJ04DRAFT_458334 [Polyplosphaeria fusca]|uniref:tRNA(Phe) (4-demethylwyosine(37)-C(7)) aminocarboxypropyltransferase n=1 Tax=Polyplosphaeria fusca TaxID=682080 RepID=A0A9P4R8X7_9PLEO|nr:hypothetical protein EJ04DRAFT_458334 [Polyplosphaeria fusca]